MLALLALTSLATLPAFAELEGIEQEIAALEQQRQEIVRRSNARNVVEIDHKLDLLRRVHRRSLTILSGRVDLCIFALEKKRPSSQPRSRKVNAAQCARAVGGVVQTVHRIEELRQEVADTDWTYATYDRKRELEAEIERLEASL